MRSKEMFCPSVRPFILTRSTALIWTNTSLSRHHPWLATFDRKSLQRRDIGVRIPRIGDHAHLHLHLRALEIDADITAPPALKEMDMRIVGHRQGDALVRWPVGRDRGADEFSSHDGRLRIVAVEPQIVGEKRMDIAAQHDWV